jgi:hypothetical protein
MIHHAIAGFVKTRGPDAVLFTFSAELAGIPNPALGGA